MTKLSTVALSDYVQYRLSELLNLDWSELLLVQRPYHIGFDVTGSKKHRIGPEPVDQSLRLGEISRPKLVDISSDSDFQMPSANEADILRIQPV